MATEEEAVEKSGFPLRKIKVQRDFRGNELLRHRGHGEKAVYRKASRRQVVPSPECYVGITPPSKQRLDASSACLIQHRYNTGVAPRTRTTLGWRGDGPIAQNAAWFGSRTRPQSGAAVWRAPRIAVAGSKPRGFSAATGR